MANIMEIFMLSVANLISAKTPVTFDYDNKDTHVLCIMNSFSKLPAFRYRLCFGVNAIGLINFLMLQLRFTIQVCPVAGESKQTSSRIYINDSRSKKMTKPCAGDFPSDVDILFILFILFYLFLLFTFRVLQRFHFRRESTRCGLLLKS